MLSLSAMLASGGLLTCLSSRLEPLDGLNNVNLLLIGEFRITRQRERLISRRLRLRQVALLVTEILETLLQVKRDRVIDLAANAVIFQMLHQRIAITRDTNHVLMEDVTAIGSDFRRHKRKPQVSIFQ